MGMAPAYGRKRRRILIFRRGQGVLLEPVGTDDHGESGMVAWPIKLPGGNRGVGRQEDIPTEFRDFELAPCNRWISGPFSRSSYAVRVHQDDHEALIRLGLVRERHRQEKAPELVHQPDRTLSTGANPLPTSTPGSPPVPVRSLIKELSTYAKEYLDHHLLASIGKFTRSPAESRDQAYQAIASPVASMSLLLGYYAFARQVAERVGYDLACVSVLSPYLPDDRGDQFWADFPNWESFHAAFVAECNRRDIRQNLKFNPGLIRDLYILAFRRPQQGLFHAWAEKVQRAQSLKGIFSELKGVHGIGDKIASFVCRDAVFLADLEGLVPSNERMYLQPIDIWIGRIAEYLNPNLTSEKDRHAVISHYLADACEFAGDSGIAFNQGSWYFGSQVAGSVRCRLKQLLDEMTVRNIVQKGREITRRMTRGSPCRHLGSGCPIPA